MTDKSIADLKPDDHIWWEGEVERIESIERFADGIEIEFVGGESSGRIGLGDGNWDCPSDEDVAEHYRFLEERRRLLLKRLEARPAHEAKATATARRVALALGKDPELAERQMRQQLDGERRADEMEVATVNRILEGRAP